MQAHERDRMQEMASQEDETMGTHWSEKSLEYMKDQEWRIFREDLDITLKGDRAQHPLNKWDEVVDLLPAAVSKAIHEMGFERPSPIQMQAIPIGLQKRDIIGIVETGSGKKTAAFMIPAVTEALHVKLKLQKDGNSESHVRVALVAADCVSAIRSFFTASLYVLEVLCGKDDADELEALRTWKPWSRAATCSRRVASTRSRTSARRR
ncbi:hypothetical protein PsorP6_016939 [Peronosclerospora sorghi]|uniref:Uncharacterized protein n=1 Tax=Peronosclerospora sorghi TaxID=230839 RepID=A0ACC0WC08_9STRA|nr:hypothetical protein PsorP6_016939 [Peronosclerospora sorghi]